MATRERPADRGADLGRELVRALGREARTARIDRGLSLREVAGALGVSATTIWRVEHTLNQRVSVVFLARFFAVVGLELSARGYPGPQPIRDSASARLLERFHGCVQPSLRWSTEVPLPQIGDQRRWDAMLAGRGWRYGVEVETGPRDAQALAGRLQLKQRDSDVDGVVLVLPATRRVAAFLAAARPVLEPLFPVVGDRALDRL